MQLVLGVELTILLLLNTYPLSPIPLPFPLPPYHLTLSTPATVPDFQDFHAGFHITSSIKLKNYRAS